MSIYIACTSGVLEFASRMLLKKIVTQSLGMLADVDRRHCYGAFFGFIRQKLMEIDPLKHRFKILYFGNAVLRSGSRFLESLLLYACFIELQYNKSSLSYPKEAFMSTIVLAHAGTGKTYCATHWPDQFLDLVSMPYKYILPEQISKNAKESETTKAIYTIEDMNPEWPHNYFDTLVVRFHLNQYEYILAPPDWRIAILLNAHEIPYTLAYPDRSLKKEYEQRFLKRGNNADFLSIFIDDWDVFIDQMDRMHPQKRIRLQSGQFLSDVLHR